MSPNMMTLAKSINRLSKLIKSSQFPKLCFSTTKSKNEPDVAQPVLEQLADRLPICVEGDDSAEFLQGLMTNDINHLAHGSQVHNGMDEDHFESVGKKKSMYAMFLNVQGRIMMDALIFKGWEPNQYILDCHEGSTKSMANFLRLYKVRRKVNVEVMCEWKTFAYFDPQGRILKEEPDREVSSALKAVDPRVKNLGHRIISRHDGDFDTKRFETGTGYRQLRYRLGVSEGCLDIPPAKCFPLEYNADYLHGVSFQKGCYIGQELTARVQHTGVVRKRVMPIRFSKTVQPVDLSTNRDLNLLNEKGKKIGNIRGISEDIGIGLMRLQETSEAKVITLESDSNVTAKVERPFWWPQEAPKQNQKLVD